MTAVCSLVASSTRRYSVENGESENGGSVGCKNRDKWAEGIERQCLDQDRDVLGQESSERDLCKRVIKFAADARKPFLFPSFSAAARFRKRLIAPVPVL